jgi:hypothetical protein
VSKRDSLWIDADPATNLPAYSGLELRGALNCFQPGVIGAGDFKVTTGAGLTVDSAAGRAAIGASAGGVIFPGLYYAVDDAAENSATFERTGGGTGIPANASTNPRLDAVVLHQYDHSLDSSGRRVWVREYVPGTPVGGAALGGTLPSLPTSSLLIAEVLVPANNPATIPSANVRDRRPWAKGAYRRIMRSAGNYTTSSTSLAYIDSTNLAPRLELSGAPCRVSLRGVSSASASHWFYLLANGNYIDGASDGYPRRNTSSEITTISWEFVPTPGSQTIAPAWNINTGTATLLALTTSPLVLVVEEIARPNADNS